MDDSFKTQSAAAPREAKRRRSLRRFVQPLNVTAAQKAKMMPTSALSAHRLNIGNS
jgi:hypothetical protein